MDKNKKIVVAVDGYSSCGKSTMAKTLAKEVGYIYADTGAMYRTVTLGAMRAGLIHDGKVDEEGLKKIIGSMKITFRLDPSTSLPIAQLNGEDVEDEIRSMAVSDNVSPVAAIPFVREKLFNVQRELGRDKGLVMDGRDIGTVIFPDAELKIFVTATAQTRARRRYDELTSKGKEADYEEVLENVKKRDYIDEHRATAPLKKAKDALTLDNSDMTIDQQNKWMLEAFRKAIAK